MTDDSSHHVQSYQIVVATQHHNGNYGINGSNSNRICNPDGDAQRYKHLQITTDGQRIVKVEQEIQN